MTWLSDWDTVARARGLMGAQKFGGHAKSSKINFDL